MKKLTALLLCFLLLCICSAPALAAQPERITKATVISCSVPDTHEITVTAENAQVFFEGVSETGFSVGRLSQPRLLIRAESGKVIKSVMLNGEDVTDLLHGGYLDLAPVYEDKVITVVTEDAPAEDQDTYTVKGKVTLNGEPLANVDLELRSTLMTTKTDENGQFVFSKVEPGKHSLTALLDNRVIGYLSFSLEKDSKTDVVLLEDGSYSVSVDQNNAGVELHLVLNEEKGTLAPLDAKTVEKVQPAVPLTETHKPMCRWWLWLLLLIIICIVAIETYRRKKKGK